MLLSELFTSYIRKSTGETNYINDESISAMKYNLIILFVKTCVLSVVPPTYFNAHFQFAHKKTPEWKLWKFEQKLKYLKGVYTWQDRTDLVNLLEATL